MLGSSGFQGSPHIREIKVPRFPHVAQGSKAPLMLGSSGFQGSHHIREVRVPRLTSGGSSPLYKDSFVIILGELL